MRRTVGSPWLENRRSPRLASGPSLLPLLSCSQLLRVCRLHWGFGCLISLRTLLRPPWRTGGLSQPGYDDEQGADHANEDQHSETDPHPLLGRPMFPDHFGSRPVSHMMRSQYIAVRMSAFRNKAEEERGP